MHVVSMDLDFRSSFAGSCLTRGWCGSSPFILSRIAGQIALSKLATIASGIFLFRKLTSDLLLARRVDIDRLCYAVPDRTSNRSGMDLGPMSLDLLWTMPLIKDSFFFDWNECTVVIYTYLYTAKG